MKDYLGLYQIPTSGKAKRGKPALKTGLEWERIIPIKKLEIEKKKGINALKDVDLFNILCIPPLQNPDGTELDIDIAVYEQALKYCWERRAILLIDPPVGWTDKSAPQEKTTGIDKFLTLRNKNAEFFSRE